MAEGPTPEQQADKELVAMYDALVTSGDIQPYTKGKVPSKVISEIKKWVKTEKFNIYQLRAKIYPICIQYQVDQKSFWQKAIQGWK